MEADDLCRNALDGPIEVGRIPVDCGRAGLKVAHIHDTQPTGNRALAAKITCPAIPPFALFSGYYFPDI
jgi:hypothetical protein